MDRRELLQFLHGVGAHSLETYLSAHGSDLDLALDTRLQWAAWNFRSPDDAAEARFLMENHVALKAILAEGETSWHLREKRAENAAKKSGNTPAPAPRRSLFSNTNPGRTRTPASPPVEAGSSQRTAVPPTALPPDDQPVNPVTDAPPVPFGLRSLGAREGFTPLPLAPRLAAHNPTPPAPTPTPAPQAQHIPLSASWPVTPEAHEPSPQPGNTPRLPRAGPPRVPDDFEPDTPVTRRPASPLSEATTVLRDDDDPPSSTPRAGGLPRSSLMPSGLQGTLADLDDDDDDLFALGLEKTGIVGDDDDPDPRDRSSRTPILGPAFLGTPMGAPLRGHSQSDQTAMVLAIGLAFAGFGALALAAALVLSSVLKEPAPAPPPPPALHEALTP